MKRKLSIILGLIVGLLALTFIFSSHRINIGLPIGILMVVTMIYWASTVREDAPSIKEEIKKEEIKEPVEPIRLKITNPEAIKKAPHIGPTKFVLDNKNRIDKVVSKINCQMLWDDSCAVGFNERKTFTQAIKNSAGNRFKVQIIMGKDGPEKLVFIGKGYADMELVKKPKEKIVEVKPEPKKTEPKKPVTKPNASRPEPKGQETNAERNGNTFINKDGKPEVKPNYKMIASDWINTSLEYLNKVCNDAAAICGGGAIHALLEASDLPPDKEAWEAIGILLKEQDEIDSFDVNENGIAITIE